MKKVIWVLGALIVILVGAYFIAIGSLQNKKIDITEFGIQLPRTPHLLDVDYIYQNYTGKGHENDPERINFRYWVSVNDVQRPCYIGVIYKLNTPEQVSNAQETLYLSGSHFAFYRQMTGGCKKEDFERTKQKQQALEDGFKKLIDDSHLPK